MNIVSNKAFEPNWASPPGGTILDILEAKRVPLSEFAHQIDCSYEFAEALIEGRTTINLALARQLRRVIGGSVEFWMSRDFQYQEDIARVQKKWMADLPLEDMIRYGWLKPGVLPQENLDACLKFFGVPSVDKWHERYSNLPEEIAFRTSPSFASKTAAVAAWLREGELVSEAIACEPWNANRFKQRLSTVRSLTKIKNPSSFIPDLQWHCSQCGVAVAIVRAPSGCRASGATRFISPKKAILQLSFRYLTDDQFWFTFFHEAGHLLLHASGDVILEGIEKNLSTKEKEANEFAARTLIPVELSSDLAKLSLNARDVVRFAVKLGVSPGIIVGQLQHLRRIGPGKLNKLKRRYKWNN